MVTVQASEDRRFTEQIGEGGWGPFASNALGLGLQVWDSGFGLRFSGLGFRVWGLVLGFRVQGLGPRLRLSAGAVLNTA